MASEAPPARPTPPSGEEDYDEDDLGGTGNSEDGEETFAQDEVGGSDKDRAFDETVGALEEMLIDPDFTRFQSSFLSAHCQSFDSSEENKLIYTSLFDEYVSRMEGFISDFLTRKLAKFDMESFLTECETRGEEQLCGDAFDVLTSMSDFAAFKEIMIAQKEQHKWQTQTSSASASSNATSSQQNKSTQQS